MRFSQGGIRRERCHGEPVPRSRPATWADPRAASARTHSRSLDRGESRAFRIPTRRKRGRASRDDPGADIMRYTRRGLSWPHCLAPTTCDRALRGGNRRSAMRRRRSDGEVLEKRARRGVRDLQRVPAIGGGQERSRVVVDVSSRTRSEERKLANVAGRVRFQNLPCRVLDPEEVASLRRGAAFHAGTFRPRSSLRMFLVAAPLRSRQDHPGVVHVEVVAGYVVRSARDLRPRAPPTIGVDR